MFMKSMFEAEAISDKPAKPKQPPQQWYIVRTFPDATEWALWRSHDNGIVKWIRVEVLLLGYKPHRYKTYNGAKRRMTELMHEFREGISYEVREWIE